MRIKEKWPDEVCYYCGGRKRHQKRERERKRLFYILLRTSCYYRSVQSYTKLQGKERRGKIEVISRQVGKFIVMREIKKNQREEKMITDR